MEREDQKISAGSGPAVLKGRSRRGGRARSHRPSSFGYCLGVDRWSVRAPLRHKHPRGRAAPRRRKTDGDLAGRHEQEVQCYSLEVSVEVLVVGPVRTRVSTILYMYVL